MTDANYYVYEIQVDGIARYIGKGKGRRVRVHLQIARSVLTRRAAGEAVRTTRFYNRLARALKSGSKIEARFIAEGLSEIDAFARECLEISKSPSGQLWNITSGGDGFKSEDVAAFWRDPEFRRKQRAYRTDPDYLAKLGATLKVSRADPEYRRAASEKMKELWSDPEKRDEYIAMIRKNTSKPEFRKKQSEITKALFASQKFREKHATAMRAVRSTPEFRARLSAGIKASHSDKSFRKAQSEKGRRKWADPKYRAKRSASFASSEVRARIAAAAKAGWIKRRQRQC